jgi:hypothetical protein
MNRVNGVGGELESCRNIQYQVDMFMQVSGNESIMQKL